MTEVKFYSLSGSRTQFVVMLRAEWESRVWSQCLIKGHSRQTGPNGMKFLISCSWSLSAEHSLSMVQVSPNTLPDFNLEQLIDPTMLVHLPTACSSKAVFN